MELIPEERRITRHLTAGDFSLDGLETLIRIERKGLQDFISCVSARRAEFQDQLERMADRAEFPFVIVCGGDRHPVTRAPTPGSCVTNILNQQYRGEVHPAAVMGTLMKWQLRFPEIRWLLADNEKQGCAMARHLLVGAEDYWEQPPAEWFSMAERRAARDKADKQAVT